MKTEIYKGHKIETTTDVSRPYSVTINVPILGAMEHGFKTIEEAKQFINTLK